MAKHKKQKWSIFYHTIEATEKNMSSEITKFIYMGDPQTSRISGKMNDYSSWSELLEKAIHECWPEDIDGGDPSEKVLVLGGDLVNKGTDDEEWNAFFDTVHQTEKKCGIKDEGKCGTEENGLTILTPTGNHSKLKSYSDHDVFARNVSLPANGPLGYEQNFYSYDYGQVHFLVLDSNYMGNRSEEAYKYIGYWIKSDLSVNTKPVTMAVFHHPMFTMGTSLDDDVRAATMRENFLKLFYRYGVDFILCGHQHMYSRTKEVSLKPDKPKKTDKPEDREIPGITQVMGVSGTKYFDAWSTDQMVALKEFLSVATIFETDGNSIRLTTIDKEGNVWDQYEKKARPPKKRRCGECINFSTCKGTGEFERLESERKAKELGDPLTPKARDGLAVKLLNGKKTFIEGDEIRKLPDYTITYSVMRRGELTYETYTGKRIRDIMDLAGFSAEEVWKNHLALYFTLKSGKQTTLNCKNVFEAKFYNNSDNEGISQNQKCIETILCSENIENNGFNLKCGQMRKEEYNGRNWAKGIVAIEVINLLDVGVPTIYTDTRK